MALPMSGGSGLDLLSATKSTNPASVAVMLTLGPCSECQHKCFAMGADYVFGKSGEMKTIITTLVLLAHQSYQQGFEGGREAGQSPVRFLSNPPGQSESFRSNVPAICPRIAASLTPTSTMCFLALGDSQTSPSPSSTVEEKKR